MMSETGPATPDSMPTIPLKEDMTARTVRYLANVLVAAYWIMVPVYIGLFLALLLIVVKFGLKLAAAVPLVLSEDPSDTMLNVLSLVDLALVGNFVMRVLLAGLGRADGQSVESGRAGWRAANNFQALKLKLVGSLSVIAGVYLLESFMHLDEISTVHVFWQICILGALTMTGVLLALTDWLAGEKH